MADKAKEQGPQVAVLVDATAVCVSGGQPLTGGIVVETRPEGIRHLVTRSAPEAARFAANLARIHGRTVAIEPGKGDGFELAARRKTREALSALSPAEAATFYDAEAEGEPQGAPVAGVPSLRPAPAEAPGSAEVPLLVDNPAIQRPAIVVPVDAPATTSARGGPSKR